MAVPEPVFVQPHFDDVALSCGGTVARYAECCAPLVLTIFGGEPRGALTAFARMQHERWTLDDVQVVVERQREDECAASTLGATVRTLVLDYPDAIYRREAYGSEEGLFGELVDEDLALVSGLTERLADFEGPLFVPLAVGNHVDHQLTFLAGWERAAAGHDVRFYADLPYALEPGALEARLGRIGASEECVRELRPADFERRWRAIECYRSQLPVLFRSLDDPRGSFEAFGRASEDGPPVERFWRIPAGREASR